jgi:hypothetical protein
MHFTKIIAGYTFKFNQNLNLLSGPLMNLENYSKNVIFSVFHEKVDETSCSKSYLFIITIEEI